MDDEVIFGLTVSQLSDFGLKFGVAGLILYMIFIIAQLAWESKAGKYGAMWMFLALGLGFVGFVAKGIIQYFLEK